MKKISVKIKDGRYDVLVGTGLLKRAGKELRTRARLSGKSQVFVVTSPNVRRHWGTGLDRSLEQAKVSYHVLEMDDGEPAKRLKTVERLAEQMVQAGADRTSLVVAFGGGVIGDCAGFLAGIFMRGIPVVQIPTTVLAQVDASIGGKTGVNLAAGKNLIGAFHQPKMVLVDPAILETLDDRQFRAGLFEALKCGVIHDRKLFAFMVDKRDKILGRDRKAVERVIVDSVRVKAAVVGADERESGLRRILNFGHTIGHALEAATGYSQLLHGEAVAWGMLAATAIARDAGFCDPESAEQIMQGIASFSKPLHFSVRADDVTAFLKSDKKAVAGKIHWVLPVRLGKATVSSEVPEELVRAQVELLTGRSGATTEG